MIDYEKQPHRIRRRFEKHIEDTYHILLIDYAKMINNQDRKCASCRRNFSEFMSGTGSSPVVDHDHKSGIVRGILCGDCNIALGLLKEDKDNIINLSLYISGKLQYARID